MNPGADNRTWACAVEKLKFEPSEVKDSFTRTERFQNKNIDIFLVFLATLFSIILFVYLFVVYAFG